MSVDRDFPYSASDTNYGRPARTVIRSTLRKSDRRFRFSASRSRLDRFPISNSAASMVSPHSSRTIVMSSFSFQFSSFRFSRLSWVIMPPRRANARNANDKNANVAPPVPDQAQMNKFLYGVSDLVKTECRNGTNAMLLGDMNISRLMTHAQ
uniref:Uncharacterized protein n=1 Tax=Solanum tuberosum TaxID=4113 RepID=M1DB45_SOLTU